LVVAYFWASFHEACQPLGQLDQVVKVLQSKYPETRFLKLEAESLCDIADSLGVSMVPAFVLLKSSNKLDLIEGANPGMLQSAIEKQLHSKNEEGEKSKVKKLIESSHVVAFIKGSASAPLCEDSKLLLSMLNDASVPYVTFDVLHDSHSLKEIKTSPPLLFIGGELIGGIEIVKELVEKQQLKAVATKRLPLKASAPIRVVDDEYLKKLVSRSEVLLFMKGSPESPSCGFSSKIVKILQNAGIEFDSFDILKDETVRQALKTFSNWPTYPQLYVNGKLLGGLDILQEMQEDEDDLAEALGIKSLNTRLKELIHKSPVMLFMKGDRTEPRCGFSRTMISILNQYQGVSFETFDILSDEQVRQGLKEFSNWPTYPQLYVNGKLVGGLDIVKEMQEDEELESLLRAQL